MDLLTAATSTTLASTPEEAYLQVRELADKAALVNLSVLYSQAVDDHDLDTVVDCFAPDGSFTRLGTTVRGHADLRSFYASMMDRYVTTLYTPETHLALTGDFFGLKYRDLSPKKALGKGPSTCRRGRRRRWRRAAGGRAAPGSACAPA